ncbi:hypothetical protein ACWGDT_36880 [Streptomyces avermitilis]
MQILTGRRRVTAGSLVRRATAASMALGRFRVRADGVGVIPAGRRPLLRAAAALQQVECAPCVPGK